MTYMPNGDDGDNGTGTGNGPSNGNGNGNGAESFTERARRVASESFGERVDAAGDARLLGASDFQTTRRERLSNLAQRGRARASQGLDLAGRGLDAVVGEPGEATEGPAFGPGSDPLVSDDLDDPIAGTEGSVDPLDSIDAGVDEAPLDPLAEGGGGGGLDMEPGEFDPLEDR